ncbi:hypothetical protein NP233_g10094 [Leucocoprinus birnbaumii]|uniref:Uncharacterized protein n=1 Tax=Leucocoprinus birnbaumii TaxID=56174 RepID=A0AAD5VPV1_9AGAR|nr:hypothetical protein NP233_g10094 [Leucocoprinus birnbaumii]
MSDNTNNSGPPQNLDSVDDISSSSSGPGQLEESRKFLNIIGPAAEGIETTPSLDFSAVTDAHLANLGVSGKSLVFQDSDIKEYFSKEYPNYELRIGTLLNELKMVYEHVVAFAVGRQIIQTCLFTPVFITFRESDQTWATMEEEVEIPRTNLCNPKTGYTLPVSGHIYRVLFRCPKYGVSLPDKPTVRHCVKVSLPRQIFFIQKPSRDQDGEPLSKFVPGLVACAISIAQNESLTEVRCCLTDGNSWRFLIVKSFNDSWNYFVSDQYELSNVFHGYESNLVPMDDLRDCIRKIVNALLIWWQGLAPDDFFKLL